MLERLFTSKTRTKLLKIFIFSDRGFRLRELERETKIPVSAVKREISNLSKIGLIQKEKDIYSLNKDCPFLDDLRNIFIKTDALAYELKSSLERLNPEYAFIFGSFADCTYSPTSDVDLFVVGDIRNIEVVKAIKKTESMIKREINPVVLSMAELKKKEKSSFVRDIAKKKLIMVIGKENELRKIIGTG